MASVNDFHYFRYNSYLKATMWSQSEISPEFLGISRILGHKLQGQDMSALAWKASGLLIALLFAYIISVGFYRCMSSQLRIGF